MAPSSSITVRILLVEEDPAYLPVATSMLQLFDFQVFIAQNPLEAVSALELRRDSFYFDLVLSDLQMSMMNAVEFRKLIDQKFHLPVVLMSSEHKRSILFGGLLQNGLPFFVDKPPSADDLMSLRQYVISKRKERGNSRSLKRRLFEDDFEAERIHELEYLTANHKRPKLVWTNELHNRFLEAVNSLGFQRAVPKKILEYMNVPGLTRENVASHLQKYRVYLKRLCKTNSSTRSGMLRSWHGGPFRSTFFCPPHPTVATNNSLPYYSNTINLGQQTTEALPFVFGQNSLGGQQAKTLPSMYAHGASTSSMPLMGTYSGAFQGPSMINTLPNNNVLYPESSGAFQGPSMINTLPNNNVLYPANILGTASASHAEMGHFTEQNNARESFIPIVQNNSQPIDGGYLTDAAMQFFSSPRPTLNLAGNNQGQTLVPMMTQMGGVTANYGGEPSVQYGGLLNNLANDMTNGNMTLPEQGNPNVNSTILADDGLESFLSSLEEEGLNKDQTPQNPFVKQDVTVAQVGNHIPTDLQVPVENIASHVPLIKNDAEQEMSNSGASSGSSVLFQDWEAGNLDEFCLDGIDDLVAFLSNFEGNNGSDNQLP